MSTSKTVCSLQCVGKALPHVILAGSKNLKKLSLLMHQIYRLDEMSKTVINDR